jgi:hypothetical protein
VCFSTELLMTPNDLMTIAPEEEEGGKKEEK